MNSDSFSGGKKVYCKNCRYIFSKQYFDYKRYFCKKTKTIKETAITKETNYLPCDYYNYNNTCLRYKRKWWKFWVKEK